MPLCRIGSRGSLLALTQTGFVRDALARRWPEWDFEIVVLKTTGDLDQKTPLSQMGGMGVFVKELELALLDHRIDLAVHSLKDVPHGIPAGLELLSYFHREDSRDVLITKHGSWDNLPQGALLGTGSPRRIAQLKSLRSDLRFTELRGNIDTRVERALQGDLDGIILASAGLNRLGKESVISTHFDPHMMIPAIAQGIVAIEGRSHDPVFAELAQGVEESDSRIAASLERGLMVSLGGGCKVPMAALAQKMSEQEWSLDVFLSDNQYQKSLRMGIRGSITHLVTHLVARVEARAKELQLTLPRDLPDHYLLQDRD